MTKPPDYAESEANQIPPEYELDPSAQPAPCCGGRVGSCNVAPLLGELTHCLNCGVLLVYSDYGWSPSN